MKCRQELIGSAAAITSGSTSLVWLGQNSTPLAKKAVSAAKTVGKTAAKLTVGKIAAIAAAVVVAVSAVIAGVVLENRENHPASDVAGSDAVTEISVSRDVLADDYCGTWFCGSDTLNIYFSEAAERYYFSYRHEDGTGYDFFGDARTLDTHIKLLRKSLGKYSKYIVTLRGVGYRFEGE